MAEVFCSTVLPRRASRVVASPRARRAMRAAGIDPHSIRGTGPNGRIVEADVQHALRALAMGANAPVQEAKFLAPPPSVLLRIRADVTALASLLDQMNDHVARAGGTAPTWGSVLDRARSMALRQSPQASPALQEHDIALVDLIQSRVDDAAISPQPPLKGVLAVGRIAPQEVFADGRRVLRQVVQLAFWVDGRLLDPPAAAEYLASVVELLERPFLLFLEGRTL